MFIATVGFFDGVHRGHRCLLAQLCRVAEVWDLRPLIITFDRHPYGVTHPTSAPKLLTTTCEKLALLRKAGVSDVRVLRFDRQMSRLSAKDFMLMLRDRMSVRMLVMGYDHHFGHDWKSGLDYASIASEIELGIVAASELPDTKVSSSAVRRLLLSGNVEEAASLLGYDYSFEGTVTHGHAIGHRLGFPTANMCVATSKLIPAQGVYAVRVIPQNSPVHIGMLNIGHRPTMDDNGAVSVEVHLLDYKGDLYGKCLRVEMVAHLRNERHFATAEALSAQLERDAATVRELLG